MLFSSLSLALNSQKHWGSNEPGRQTNIIEKQSRQREMRNTHSIQLVIRLKSMSRSESRMKVSGSDEREIMCIITVLESISTMRLLIALKYYVPRSSTPCTCYAVIYCCIRVRTIQSLSLRAPLLIACDD